MIKNLFVLLILSQVFVLTNVAIADTTKTQSVTQTVTDKASATKGYLSDTAITTKVKSKLLLDKEIKSLSIEVTTTSGVVTLTGNVDNEKQKKHAVKIASHVSGVKSVKDNLVILKQ